MRVHVFASRVTGHTSTVYAAAVTTDAAGTTVPSAQDDTEILTDTPDWYTLDVTLTAGVTNYLYVWTNDGGGVKRIHAVYAIQDEWAVGELVTGTPAQRLLPVSPSATRPGAAIVNTLSGAGIEGTALSAAETVQNRWTDRYASLNNAVWWAQTRGRAIVPFDWCYPEGHAGDIDPQTIPARLTPTFGTTQIQVCARVRQPDLAANERLQMSATLDTVGLAGSPRTIGDERDLLATSRRREHWEDFGVGAVAWNTTHDIEVSTEYRTRNNEPQNGAGPAVIEGMAAWEVAPNDSPNLVHVRAYTASGGDVASPATSTATVARSFTIGMVRVVASFTAIGDAADLVLSLAHDNGGSPVTRLLANSDLAAASGDMRLSFSDAAADDTAPTETLDAFRGLDSADDWTLTASGTTGTLVGWSLEIW
jgi:hypothetical protein